MHEHALKPATDADMSDYGSEIMMLTPCGRLLAAFVLATLLCRPVVQDTLGS